MQEPVVPGNESQRLHQLRAANILDTQPEERFDRLTRLAQRYFQVEIALVSLVDETRQWFKSKQGLDACETGRGISFCGHSILSESILEIPDARKDPRFADNPLVTGAPFIAFYAGAPLRFEGQLIGTLCIIDSSPRKLDESDYRALRDYADAVEQEVIDRLADHNQQKLSDSELRYRSVLEATNIGTWQWNVQTGETIFNRRWAEIIGYSLDDLEPVSIETWQHFAHPEDLERSAAALEKHFQGAETHYDIECRMRHKAGHWVWVHDRGQVIEWTEDGKPLLMFGTHADITERRLHEQELRESKEQFKALVENIPGITYRCLADEHWTMVYMSGDIDPLSGYPASDFIGNRVRSYASVIHPGDQEEIEKQIAQSFRERSSWLLNYRILHKDGSVRYVEERGSAEYDENGQVRFLDGFILDVTDVNELKDRLLKLTSQVPGMLYQFQQWPDGRTAFPFTTDNIKHIYGVTAEQVKADASLVFDAIDPRDLNMITESINTSAANLNTWQQEYRVRDKDGGVKWLLGRATPERMPDNSTLWHGYIYDITTTKQHYLALEEANEELHLAQRRLELSSKQAQIGYWKASLKTGSLWWSHMIYELFGFDAERTEPSVALFKDAVHPDDLALVEASEQRAKETGLHDVVHRIIRQDGEVRWVHELAQLLPESANPDLIMIGTVQDVTERMQLQKIKDEFIATVSHELRTPLTSISGALRILESTHSNALNEKGLSLLTVANNNVKRLLRLINDLLDIEKLLAGKMSFDILPHAIDALLEQAILNHTTYAERFDLQMSLDNQVPANKGQILVDENRFQQVMANLLSNAIKFSPKDGLIAITARLIDGQVEIAIADEGEGISGSYRNRLFEKFSQADSSDSKSKGGTGLGLAVSKELVEKMGGTIGYRDNEPEGACFYFRVRLN